MDEGIYFGLAEDVYHAAEGLSNSGMKLLQADPLVYWHRHFDPEREPPEETYAQMIGKAVHCRLLEPDRYPTCYAKELSKEDHPGCLVTTDDLKGFCSAKNLPVAAKVKQDLVDRIHGAGFDPPIWDALKKEADLRAAGKSILKAADYKLVERLAATTLADPLAKLLMSDGMPEVSIFLRDPTTSVMLKCRMDYLKPKLTVDLKTFSNSRGKATDRAVFDALYYEGYYIQAAFYTRMRRLARDKLIAGELAVRGDFRESFLDDFLAWDNPGFAFVFVESSAPFALRVIQLKRAATEGAEPNIYHHAAAIRIDAMIALYAECHRKYGTSRWADAARIHLLEAMDLPQLAFN